ncbi:hypothetical protein FDP41_011981 [Naegleria fowleri]|uniref:Uncharacterized protein n=1 Tax=Naegleria fowleri TaxID=5763 RepID=A0A6A5C8N8_NAEFO|nr:uncharacterized protein FDP41_011981 [Naegleria fowleri]KAF0982120.1 hypothetical protein FDP41_011981 [Naegleria fowleri]CAG4713745.1 unnamed protein product [Naegleria fowleri]
MKPSSSSSSSKKTSQGIPPKFIVDDNGHIINKEKHAIPNSAFPDIREPLCQSNFNFTPVGYTGFGVRPNHVIQGVRPELQNTVDNAHHFLHKHENQKSFGHSTIRKTNTSLSK